MFVYITVYSPENSLTLVPFEKDISFNSEKAIQFAQLLCVLSKKSVSSGLDPNF